MSIDHVLTANRTRRDMATLEWQRAVLEAIGLGDVKVAELNIKMRATEPEPVTISVVLLADERLADIDIEPLKEARFTSEYESVEDRLVREVQFLQERVWMLEREKNALWERDYEAGTDLPDRGSETGSN